MLKKLINILRFHRYFDSIRILPPSDNAKPYNHTKPSPYVRVICPNKLTVGHGSTFNDFCWISAKFGVTIGENTLIGPYTIIHSANHVIKGINIEQNGGGNLLGGERWVWRQG